MIRVIVEGPQGSGKTRLTGLFVQACLSQGLSTISCDEGKEEDWFSSADVVFVERQTREQVA